MISQANKWALGSSWILFGKKSEEMWGLITRIHEIDSICWRVMNGYYHTVWKNRKNLMLTDTVSLLWHWVPPVALCPYIPGFRSITVAFLWPASTLSVQFLSYVPFSSYSQCNQISVSFAHRLNLKSSCSLSGNENENFSPSHLQPFQTSSGVHLA